MAAEQRNRSAVVIVPWIFDTPELVSSFIRGAVMAKSFWHNDFKSGTNIGLTPQDFSLLKAFNQPKNTVVDSFHLPDLTFDVRIPQPGPGIDELTLESFNRDGCSQCHAAGIQCTWPEQRKRGPAKGYIEGLEHRLHEAESLLLALLPVVSSDQLRCATESLNSNPSTANILGLKSRDSQSPTPHTRSSPPVLNKKTGIEYWESFPLDTVDNVRKWQDDCAMHSHGNGPNQSSFRNSMDDGHSLAQAHHNLNNSRNLSRPGSVDLSRHGHGHSHSHSQSGPFRSSSNDSYRSGTSTPVHAPQHSLSHPTIPTNSNPQQSSQSQNQTSNWQSLSLFSPVASPNTTNANPASSHVNSVGIGAEALLLQSFADSSWAQSQSLSNGIGSMSTGIGSGMGVESGPMEIDTGFFSSDMQRRLFW